MNLSLHEIKDTLKKAALGKGLPVGLAEEVGQAGIWLIENDQDGLNAAILAIDDGYDGPATLTRKCQTIIFLEARIATCGPSVIDILFSDPFIEEIQLLHVDSPFLLIGLIGVSIQDFQNEITLKFSNGATAQISRNNFKIYGGIPETGEDANMTLRKLRTTESGKTKTLPKNLAINIEAWRYIETLAAKTYVQSNELSRTKGAGAGLIDNN